MVTFVLILIIITALLLIGVAALQNSQKEGGNALGSMGAHQIIGVKKTGDLLEQITWGLLIALFVLCMTTFTLTKRAHKTPQSPNLERVEQQNLLTEPSQEGAGAAPTPDNKDAEAAKEK
jgi:preprotein translocase subunit SecG